MEEMLEKTAKAVGLRTEASSRYEKVCLLKMQ